MVGHDGFGGDTPKFGAQCWQVHVAVDAAELLSPPTAIPNQRDAFILTERGAQHRPATANPGYTTCLI
jgi:hypothetical protein